MPEVIDNYIHKDIAREIYNSLVDRFSLRSYKSICCYDSLIDRAQTFDYFSEADFLFEQHVDIEKTTHHFYINSFQHGSRTLGPHQTIDSMGQSWNKHLLLLLTEGHHCGGDIYFTDEDWDPWGIVNYDDTADWDKTGFKHNRFLRCDPQKHRALSFIEESKGPMLYLNLLTQ